VRAFHNLQQEEIVEDVGRSIPRIYATVDNKKVEFKSHMIEVEGMINNQAFNILIYSGDIHSYIDPKVVDILFFPRSKHEEYWLV
jgi:hypothetical protein